MLNRRQFLVTVAAGLTGVVTWRYISSNDVDAIVAILEKRLNYLKLEPSGVNAFAKDLVERQIVSSGKLRLIDMAGPVYTNLSSLVEQSPLTHSLKHGEERIVSLYLLSSDFFKNGHDESKLVQYIEFYEPFTNVNACMTSFARPVKYNTG